MIKEARIYNGKKTFSLISSAGETGQLPVKEWNEYIFSQQIQKLTQNGLKT